MSLIKPNYALELTMTLDLPFMIKESNIFFQFDGVLLGKKAKIIGLHLIHMSADPSVK